MSKTREWAIRTDLKSIWSNVKKLKHLTEDDRNNISLHLDRIYDIVKGKA